MSINGKSKSSLTRRACVPYVRLEYTVTGHYIWYGTLAQTANNGPDTSSLP